MQHLNELTDFSANLILQFIYWTCRIIVIGLQIYLDMYPLFFESQS
jgi:hypothetical protein